jgi:hypothetical protein
MGVSRDSAMTVEAERLFYLAERWFCIIINVLPLSTGRNAPKLA